MVVNQSSQRSEAEKVGCREGSQVGCEQGHLQYFIPTFRSAKERSSVMLIVTAGRQVGTSYRVAYQAL